MAGMISIFEDEHYSNLFPLVYFRPVFELKCGINSLKEKIERNYPDAETSLLVRSYLADVVREKGVGQLVNEIGTSQCLFINGRILADEKLSSLIPVEGEDQIYLCNGIIAAARLSGNNLSLIKDLNEKLIIPSLFPDLPKVEVNLKFINYPWDLVNNNGEQIRIDFKNIVKKNIVKEFPGAHLINRKEIYIGSNANISPTVVLDASNGPIFIGENVKIMPHVGIEGPCFIGDNSVIKMHSAIYHNTTIGEYCKVGGEVEESIIHSYSNKQHSGFLGHSYLGSWINIGADTNNSDLKNNYGNISVKMGNKNIDTGSQFVGLIMGDHSKTAINTMFNTGTISGICCNIFGAGFPKRYLPSFTWGGSDLMKTNNLNESISVAEKVMFRRNVKMSKADKELFKFLFTLTSSDR